MEQKDHIDGSWMTSEHSYENRKILIKSRKGKGMKCHVFLPSSERVDFTLRYKFIKPEDLLQKAKDKVDRQCK